MLELKNYRLYFEFPEVHPNARMEVIFHRTLRIPDDGRTYPLPPSLGTFPIAHVDDYKEKVPEKWIKHGGIMLPMWQSEAMWLQFQSCHVPGHAHVWPFAIKVSTGKRSAVTGKPWSKTLREGDYLIIPEQRWLDGYVVEDGVIKQFIAAPLGMGITAEEQITGKAEFGGLQLEVYPMTCVEYMKRWPKLPPPPSHTGHMRRSMLRSCSFGPSEEKTFGGVEFEAQALHEICDDDSFSEGTVSCNAVYAAGPAAASNYSSNSINLISEDMSSQSRRISEDMSSQSRSLDMNVTLNSQSMKTRESVTKGIVSPQAAIRLDMGLAPGGRMAQQVFADTYGVETWDREHHDRCFVHLSNSLAWKAVTGKDAPTVPLSASDYSKAGMPWFEHYCDAPTVQPTSKLAALKSAVQMGIEKGVAVVLENESAQPKKVIHTGQVRDGKWG